MKKIFLLTILLFQLSFVFGQEPQWSPWISVSCYKGIQYSINNLGYNKSTNSYWWNIKWKNNYSKAVSFDGVVTIDGESIIRGGWGNIQPGGIQTYTSVPYKSSSINFSVSVSKVCFSDKYGGCSETLEGWANYAECDNGTPNYKINGKNTVNSNINSTNQTNNSTQQNDLTEYNLSKADLERQMAEKNAEIQRQNLENQRQQFNRLYNEGISLKSEGNFGAAKNRFNDALKFATNDSERQQAQKALNQNDADSKTYLINSSVKLTNIISTGIQQQKEWSAEQKRKKAESLKQINIDNIKAEEAAINTLTDPKIFESYCNFIVANMETLGFKFENMSDYKLTITSKKIKILFSNDLNVEVDQLYSTSKPATMYNNITFRTTNSIYGNIIKNSDLFDFFKQLDYFDYEGHKNYYTIEKDSEYVYNFKLFGLEKTDAFTNIYINGYNNPNYSGANNYIKKIEENVQNKLSNTQVSTKELIENGDIYRYGKGVEKNIIKALEFYNIAKEQGDNEATLYIANTYLFEIKEYEKAKKLLEKYISLDTIKNEIGAKSSLSYTYDNLGDFDKAINVGKEAFALNEIEFKKAKNNKEKYETKIMMGFTAKSIAQCYINIGNANEAIKWFEIAASYDYFSAITLAQIYNQGSANQFSAVIKPGSKLKSKKSKKLAIEWANKACQVANNDISIYGDTSEKKKELEKSAKWCCDFVQNSILKD